jgi:peptidoglycan/LPS O-acetylase OafA/YrhL
VTCYRFVEMGEIQRKPALDGLRGAAALLVLCAHLKLFGPVVGQLGVMIFFVLSGYLLGYIYLNRPCDGQTVWKYLIRRGGRILPLYYIAVTLALVMQANGELLFGSITSPLYHYLCIQGAGVFWTVAIETQFYVLFVALWWISTKRRAALYAILLPMIVIPFLKPFSAWQLISMPFFAVGVLISRAPILASSRWAWSALFPSIVIATFALGALGTSRPLHAWQMPIYLAIVGGLLLASVQSDLARWLLGNPVASYIGTISFSVYLVHLPVITLLGKYTALKNETMLFVTSAVAITLVLSALSYRYIERPGQALAARLAAGRKGEPLSQPGTLQPTLLVPSSLRSVELARTPQERGNLIPGGAEVQKLRLSA